MEERSCSVEVLYYQCSFPCRKSFLCNRHTNNSDLKFNLAGNLPITLLLAVGKQNYLKYFYLTATVLANKIVALVFLCTQNPTGGFSSAGVG